MENDNTDNLLENHIITATGDSRVSQVELKDEVQYKEVEKQIITATEDNCIYQKELTDEVQYVEVKKLIITEEEKEIYIKKAEEIFNEKLLTLFTKFTDDIEMMEKMKYEFNDLYYELNKIKTEIIEFNYSKHSTSLTSRDSKHSSILLTSSNIQNNTKKINDNLRSKTPIKLKSNRLIDTKESNNITSKIESKNFNREISKTPNNSKKIKHSFNNINIPEKPLKTESMNNNLNKTNTLLKSLADKPDVLKHKISNQNEITNLKKTAQPRPSIKRDLTPIIKKKQINLDISSISNLDNSITVENKNGKDKPGKISIFNSTAKANKQDLNNTVVEKSKNTLAARDKEKKGVKLDTNKSKKEDKKEINTKEEKSKLNEKAKIKKEEKKDLKINNKPDKDKEKNNKIEKEKLGKIEESKNDKDLQDKKEDLITNIMDIIAQKNKEVNIEEIINHERNEKSKNEFDKKLNEDLNENVILNVNVNVYKEKEEEVKDKHEEEVKDKYEEDKNPEILIENNLENKKNNIDENIDTINRDKKEYNNIQNFLNYNNKKNKYFHQILLTR